MKRSVLARGGIPWPERLSTQLMGVTVVLLAVVIAASFLLERGVRVALLGQATSGAELFSSTIVSATDRAMLEDRRSDAYATMADIGRQPGIVRVRMVNKDGRVTFSTNADEVGKVLPRSDPACVVCHGLGSPLSRQKLELRSRIVEADDGRWVGLVTPIYNEDRCASSDCHRHSRAELVLGVLDVGVSLEDVDRRIGALRLRTLTTTVVAVVLLGSFLIWTVRRRVVWPVAALVEGTRRVAAGDLGGEIAVEVSGELGALATSFNEMTRALRRVEADLRNLNQELEAKVAERTAALERAHAALLQSEKLSSLGQLAASIAHEINNPLAGILTFAKLLTRQAAEDVPDEGRRRALVKNLSLVQRESERCSAIVRNLLDFARERPLQLRDVDVERVVRESLELIGHQLALQGHRVVVRLSHPLPPVHADHGELRQAFLNLALNASEAMVRDGHLKVEARATADGRHVEILIADSGPGIPEEIRPRIFDPFFTTKEKGTGLGLSVVYGIVQRHAGVLELVSEPGKGACFVIRLPSCAAAGEVRSPPALEETLTEPGDGTSGAASA